MTSGSGQVGYWQGVARSSLLSWQSADFTDLNSLSQDPLFVDPNRSWRDDRLRVTDRGRSR